MPNENLVIQAEFNGSFHIMVRIIFQMITKFRALFLLCLILGFTAWFFLRSGGSDEHKENVSHEADHGSKNSFQASDEPLKTIITETPDHATLLREAKELGRGKVTHRFATAIPVDFTPSNAGEWTQDGEREIWTLNIQSPGASSLNLGFTKYWMPEGGELSIHQPDLKSPYRSFTHADNEEHGELWTPLLSGEEMVVSVSLPQGKRDQLALQLGSINHGFRPIFSRASLKNGFKKSEAQKIGGDTSALCNIDAVCRSGDANIDLTLGPVLDLFQDQIRSVAAYTLGGIDTCSGALINNTRNDRTPYFLTARHCFEGENDAFVGNPATAVFYFNFQNSYCRPRSSAESAGIGDGSLTQFSSGSTLRAQNPLSDFCLLEIDDPLPDDYDVFYAGWNRNNVEPSMAVGIHHPAVAEKRISLDADALSQSGNYWVVNDWDFGTTEGGSSGSPLFDSNGHIVGQLFGGFAACGNDLSDLYGKVVRSWTGNGSNATRLRNWLDPIRTGATTLDGISHSIGLTIADAELVEGQDGVTNMIFTVRLSESSDTSISVNYQTIDDSALAESDYTETSGTLTFQNGEVEQTISVPIFGDHSAEEDEIFLLTLSQASGAIIRMAQAAGSILTDDFSAPVLSGPNSVNAISNSAFSHQLETAHLPAIFSLSGSFPPGMIIDEETGLVEWVPPLAGAFQYTVTATNSAGSDSRTVDVIVTNGSSLNTLSATELDSLGIGFQSSSAPWFRQTAITRDGVDALRSGQIGHNEFSEFTITVNGPGTISFWQRVSTEESYDFVYFVHNGEILFTESGTVNWTRYTYDLEPGLNYLNWIYAKDFSVNEGSDRVWIDEITFSGYAGWTAAHGIATTGIHDRDAEGDGVDNLLEYATGLTPTIDDAHLAPLAELGADRLLRLSFTKPSGISDVIYEAQTSDDLDDWNIEDRSILTDDNNSFDAKQTPSTPPAPKKFMRLHVSPVSPNSE